MYMYIIKMRREGVHLVGRTQASTREKPNPARCAASPRSSPRAALQISHSFRPRNLSLVHEASALPSTPSYTRRCWGDVIKKRGDRIGF